MINDQVTVSVTGEKATVRRAGGATRPRTVHVSGDSLETCQRAPLEESCVSQESCNKE